MMHSVFHGLADSSVYNNIVTVLLQLHISRAVLTYDQRKIDHRSALTGNQSIDY